MGVSEATVFSYFRGKRELCARVIADWYDENIAAFEAGMPQDASVQQQFAFIVRTHLRLMLVNGTGLCALVLSEGRAKQHALSDATALQRALHRAADGRARARRRPGRCAPTCR